MSQQQVFFSLRAEIVREVEVGCDWLSDFGHLSQKLSSEETGRGQKLRNATTNKTRTHREVGTLQNVKNVALSCFELPVVAGVTHDKVKRYYQRFKNILLCRNWIHTHGNKFIPELMKLLCEKVQLLILDPSIDICMLFQFEMLRAFLDLVANWLVTNTWSWMGHDIGLALHAL